MNKKSSGDNVVSHKSELKKLIAAALSKLTPKEKKVLEMMLGMDNGYAHTPEEVGFVFNVSAEEIEGIRDNAFKRLKKIVEPENLEEYLNLSGLLKED